MIKDIEKFNIHTEQDDGETYFEFDSAVDASLVMPEIEEEIVDLTERAKVYRAIGRGLMLEKIGQAYEPIVAVVPCARLGDIQKRIEQRLDDAVMPYEKNLFHAVDGDLRQKLAA